MFAHVHQAVFLYVYVCVCTLPCGLQVSLNWAVPRNPRNSNQLRHHENGNSAEPLSNLYRTSKITEQRPSGDLTYDLICVSYLKALSLSVQAELERPI